MKEIALPRGIAITIQNPNPKKEKVKKTINPNKFPNNLTFETMSIFPIPSIKVSFILFRRLSDVIKTNAVQMAKTGIEESLNSLKNKKPVMTVKIKNNIERIR